MPSQGSFGIKQEKEQSSVEMIAKTFLVLRFILQLRSIQTNQNTHLHY